MVSVGNNGVNLLHSCYRPVMIRVDVPMETVIPLDTRCCITSMLLFSSGAKVSRATSSRLPYMGFKSVERGNLYGIVPGIFLSLHSFWTVLFLRDQPGFNHAQLQSIFCCFLQWKVKGFRKSNHSTLSLPGKCSPPTPYWNVRMNCCGWAPFFSSLMNGPSKCNPETNSDVFPTCQEKVWQKNEWNTDMLGTDHTMS